MHHSVIRKSSHRILARINALSYGYSHNYVIIAIALFTYLLSPSSPRGAAAVSAPACGGAAVVVVVVAVAAEFGGVGTSSSCGSPLAAPIHELTWFVNPENIFTAITRIPRLDGLNSSCLRFSLSRFLVNFFQELLFGRKEKSIT